MTLNSKSILNCSRNSKLIICDNEYLFGYVFWGLAHAEKTVSSAGMVEDGIGEVFGIHGTLHVIHRHLFNASTYSDFDLSGSDFGGNECTGFETWGTEPIDGKESGGFWEAGEEGGHFAGDGTWSWLIDISDDNVLD